MRRRGNGVRYAKNGDRHSERGEDRATKLAPRGFALLGPGYACWAQKLAQRLDWLRRNSDIEPK
ncbi:MAG: hypothetical protein IPH26_13030 [Sterolibacteriaceae bacterium]|uniref:Uncharacterized protein n=1 Tax=Candidatus Methylophosphatis roskildensis TaxID=2899263 RepID=A0A9D7DZL0_9PROT|nr:hypothetical protein [Candidatus Methylophosphatis roskildensis]